MAGSTVAAAWFAGCGRAAAKRTRRLALNPSTLRGYKLGLQEQVQAAIAAGFRGFEPWLKDIHAAQTAGVLKDIVKMARDGGLAFVNGIAFGMWSHPDAKIRAAGLEETKRDMAVLAEMGCPYVAASMFGLQKAEAPKVTAEEVGARYVEVLSLGRQMGVKPLFEYWGHSANLARLEDALAVLKAANQADGAILADVYHTYRGGSSFESFRALTAAQLPVLHVNDIPAGKPREQLTDPDRVWPGDGIAPWQQLFAILDQTGADPWLSLELFNPAYWKTTPAETLQTALAKMQRLV